MEGHWRGGGVLIFSAIPNEVTKKAFYCLNDDFLNQIFKIFTVKQYIILEKMIKFKLSFVFRVSIENVTVIFIKWKSSRNNL